MRRNRLLMIGTVIALSAALLALVSGVGDAAMVRLGTLVLRADGGFEPHVLPRHRFAPISFQGHADIGTTDSTPPPALQQVTLEFDRDGHLDVTGLPVCPPSKIEGTTPQQARKLCGAAMVSTGHIAALVTLPGSSSVQIQSPLTLFNGPRVEGDPTVLAHARSEIPAPETYVVMVRIERRGGSFAYRTTFEVPKIAGGYGVLTHVDLKIGKRYRFHGVEHSYVSARCSDSILETHGRFLFADGTIISGDVFKPCTPRG